VKVTEQTKRALAVRRERRDMERSGYRQCEPFWELNRGALYGARITDVKISVCGKYVWAKASQL
jgi:hypothetical protein